MAGMVFDNAGTALELFERNPHVPPHTWMVEKDTGKMKLSGRNGARWNDLPYAYLPFEVDAEGNLRLPVDVADASLTTVDIRQGGIVGDGVTDEGARLNTFLAANAGKTIVSNPGTVIRTTVPIVMPTGTRWRAYGTRLVNNSPGDTDRALRIVSVTDVLIEGLEVDGEKASHAAATEHRHNVWIEDSDDITLRDVYSHDAKGDGYYVGDNNTVANYCTNITLVSCRGMANHRNGLSVVAVDGFVSVAGTFNGQSGTSPQAGVDVEPNSATTVLRDVHFLGTICKDNVGPAFGVALHATGTDQAGVHVVGGSMTGSTHVTGSPGTSTGRGFSIRNPRSVWISDVEVTDNAADGFYIDSTGTARDLHVSNATIARNGYHGADVFNVPDVAWDKCWFLDNGQATANTYDGLSVTPTAATVGHRVTNCKFNGAQMRYGLRTGTFLSALWLALNDFATMGTADTSLSDDLATRFDVSTLVQLPSTGEIRWNGSEIRLFRNTTNQLRTASTFLAAKLHSLGDLEVDAALDHDGATVGFYGTVPIAKQTGVAVDAAAIHAALVALGLISA